MSCPVAPKPPRKRVQYHKAEFDGLRSHVSSFANTYLDSDPVNRSIDKNWNIIVEGIKEAIDNYIPHCNFALVISVLTECDILKRSEQYHKSISIVL